MFGTGTLPGDSQTHAFVRDWIKSSGGFGTIVVVRCESLQGWAYYLTTIETISAENDTIRTLDFGEFHLDGRSRSDESGLTRIIVPAEDVRDAAISGEIWRGGKKIKSGRRTSATEAELAKALEAQPCLKTQ